LLRINSFYSLSFCTPLSINLADQLKNGFGVYFPTEPLLAGMTLVFLLKVFYDWKYDIQILKHPVTVVVILNLIWIAICCITSASPLISIKFLVARIWFVIPLYFVGIQVFKHVENIRIFPWLYTIPMIAVVVYTIIYHATFGFDHKAAHWVMQPFYTDHTQYGAVFSNCFILF